MLFTDETKEIVEFLVDNHSHFKKMTANKKTNGILLNIFDSIKKSEQEIMKIKNDKGIEKIIKNNIIFEGELNHLLDGVFIPPEIKEHVNNYTNAVVFKANINNRYTTLNFYNSGETNSDFEQLDNMALLLFTIFNFLSKSSVGNCAETMNVHLFLTDFKKTLPSDKSGILGNNVANSAVTYHGAKNGTMLIFRKEEFIKVFIHESIHSLGLDWLDNDILKDDIKKIFNIQSKFLINEAYTEFWANILNCCLISYKLNKKNKESYLSHANHCISFETFFSINQSIKILKYMGLSYSHLYKSDPISEKLRENNYRETSNIFSYYILKTIMLFNHHGFLDLCEKHNHGLLNFKDIGLKGGILINFIKSKYKTKSFLKIIDMITCVDTSKLSNFIKNTTRLTSMEYKL